MKVTFSYYDFLAMLIPGFATLMLAYLHYYGYSFPLPLGKDIGSMSAGYAILILALAFLIGELLHAVANILLGSLFFFAGEPTTWLVSDKNRVISNPLRERIITYILTDRGGKKSSSEIRKKELKECFFFIEGQVRKESEHVKELDKTLSRQSMYRSLSFIFLAFIFTSLFVPSLNTSQSTINNELYASIPSNFIPFFYAINQFFHLQDFLTSVSSPTRIFTGDNNSMQIAFTIGPLWRSIFFLVLAIVAFIRYYTLSVEYAQRLYQYFLVSKISPSDKKEGSDNQNSIAS